MLPLVRVTSITVSPRSNRRVTKTDVGNRAIAITALTILLVGGLWTTLGFWTRKVVECFKWGLIGHPIRSMENNRAEGDMDRGVSEGTVGLGRMNSIS